MILLALLACWEPTITDETGMVGHVFDAEGQPLAGLKIHSLEEEFTTKEDGRFAVQYKAPNQLLHFTRGGVTFYRRYAAADDNTSVELTLPATRSAVLHCPEDDCMMELTWDLSERFEAVARGKCQQGAEIALPEIPKATPVGSCTVGHGKKKKALKLELQDRDEQLWLATPGSRLPVTVAAPDGVDCSVRHGETALELKNNAGMISGRGLKTVWAVCDGIPGPPQLIKLELGTPPLELAWSADHVSLPWSGEDLVVRAAGRAGRWVMRPEKDEGEWKLPLLPEGMYFFVDPEDASKLPRMPNASNPPGKLVLMEREGATIGAMVVGKGGLSAGAVPVVKE